MKLKDIYRPGSVTVGVDDNLAVVARRMEQAQVGALAVIDEAGRLVGIFAERDLVRATARRMLDLGIRHLPVTAGDGELVGMVSMRDLLADKAWM